MKIVAVGDVHGCAKQLAELVTNPDVTGDELIFLGDLFDRSPFIDGDQAVLGIMKIIQDNPKVAGFNKVTILRGNHEDMLMRAIERGPQSGSYELWEWNGGDPEFYSIAKLNRDWLEELPLYAIRGDYLFVHAGVKPGVPIEEQKEKHLLWIRERFLDAEDHGLPYTIVHGHTIVPEIDVQDKRINLDTGCFHTGKLSYMEFDYEPTMGSTDGLQRETTDRSSDCKQPV